MKEGLRTYFPERGAVASDSLLAPDAGDALRKHVEADPGSIGKTIQVKVPVSGDYDANLQGRSPDDDQSEICVD